MKTAERRGGERARPAGTQHGWVFAAILIAIALAPVATHAKEEGSRWKWSAAAEATGTYDSNVFNLDTDGEDRVDDPDDTDRDTDRVQDMDSVQDFITSTRAEFEAETKTSLGKLSLGPRVAYHYFTLNPEKSFPEFGFEVRQRLPDDSAVELDFEYELGMFKKNYLNDVNGSNRTVDRDERVYERGKYDDIAIELSHDRRLWKGKKHDLLREIEGEVLFGYSRREFGSDFPNRDLDVFTTGIEFTQQLGRMLDRIELELGYEYSFKDAPGKRELVILDEEDVDFDLNGNGNASDDNLATRTRVDRSRDVHTLGAGFVVDLPHRLEVGAGYAHTWNDYRSNKGFDIAHNGRNDTEHAVSAGLEWGFAKNWTAELNGEAAFVDSNRTGSATGDEEAEKTRYGFGLTFGADF